jgi:anti-sigma regulatory factor (Ser/Thr protein kinase)
VNINVEIAETSVPDGLLRILGQLPRIEELTDSEVTITLTFKAAYLYRTGLVLLATWRKSLPTHVKVVVDDSDCAEASKRVLTSTGFKELIESNAEGPSSIHYHPGRIPIQPIVRGYSTEHAISDICKVFRDSIGQLNATVFRTLLSELCENTYAHSEFETPGYISANLHKDTYEIAIADSGIGILNSFLEGTNQEAKNRIRRGASALELSIDGLSSSKPGRHFGYGLFIVRRVLEENRGRLTIISGNECMNVEMYRKDLFHLERPWKGTFVSLLIDTNNPLPLDEVYNEGVALLVPEGGQTSKPAPTMTTTELALAEYGSQLLTREIGIRIRADIATILSGGSRVRVLLDGVEDLTPSVADESFGKLAESMGRDRFREHVLLSGGQPLLGRLIEFVVTNRIERK